MSGVSEALEAGWVGVLRKQGALVVVAAALLVAAPEASSPGAAAGKPAARGVPAKTKRPTLPTINLAALQALVPVGHQVVRATGPGNKRYSLLLDSTNQVLRLNVPQDRGYGSPGGQAQAPIYPSLSRLRWRPKFVSASVLAAKAKQFDDGLYAAVEVAAGKGAGLYPSRNRLLLGMLAAVLKGTAGPDRVGSAALLTAAARLGGLNPKVPAVVDVAARAIVSGFMKRSLKSKPLGFYTWNSALEEVFRRDRLLQKRLNPRVARIIGAALASDSSLQTSYSATLSLATGLTNPLAWNGLERIASSFAAGRQVRVPAKVSTVPPSRSVEATLIKQLYGNRPIPPGFNLVNEIVTRVRAGKLSLRPRPDSGWYDHQTWALEPLIVPGRTAESRHLSLAQSYRKELLGLFKALLALTRETHVKQLWIPKVGMALPIKLSIEVLPTLGQEPLATYYLRRALSYRFARRVLERSFGKRALAALRRLRRSGPVKTPLGRELREMEALFYGAYLATARELGMSPTAMKDLGLPGGAGTQLAHYRRWASAPHRDGDAGADLRMMVPVFHDVIRKKTKVWAVLGLATRHLQIGFKRPPVVKEIRNAAGMRIARQLVKVKFKQKTVQLLYLVSAEVYVTKVMNRQEFRKHCDRYKTRMAILANLK